MAENNYDLEYTGSMVDRILDTGYDLQNQGYIFRGLASQFIGTPTERSWLIAATGSTGYGLSTPVPPGAIGICVFNGSTWSASVLNTVTLENTPVTGSANGITSGAVKTLGDALALSIRELAESTEQSIQELGDSVTDRFESLNFEDTTGQSSQAALLSIALKYIFNGEEETITTLSILGATSEKAGLMSAQDKAKLDAYISNIRSIRFDDTTGQSDQGEMITETLKWTLAGTEEVITILTILSATAQKAGLMSSTDKSRIDALWSSGYQFAGFATPSTTPVSTAAKVFYIATEAGTYFNAVTVTQGINILLWDGSTWSSVQVVGIDDEPTADSNNLVKSGGVYPILKNVSHAAGLNPLEVISDSYLRADGTYVSDNKFRVWIFRVEPNGNYLFSETMKAGWTFKFVTWLDNGKDPISSEPYAATLTEDGVFVDQPIYAPSNAEYLALSIYNDYINTVNLTAIGDMIPCQELLDKEEKNKAVLSDAKNVEQYSVQEGERFTITGYKSDSSFNAVRYSVEAGETYLLNAYMPKIYAGVYVLFYVDSSDNVISYFYRTYTSDSDDLFLIDEITKAPEDASYAIVNVYLPKKGLYSLLKSTGYLPLRETVKESRNKASIASISEFNKIEPSEVISGKYFGATGNVRDAGYMAIWKFHIDPEKIYAFCGGYTAGINVPFVGWLDGDDWPVGASNFISSEPYKGKADEGVTYYKQEVIPPSNAQYAVMNVLVSQSNKFKMLEIGDIIDLDEMRREVDVIEKKNMEVTFTGNPSSVNSTISIRTSFSESKDIVVVYKRKNNDNITPFESYIGGRDDSTDAIMVSSNVFHHWEDSTAPIYNETYAPWHLYAQHGYEIPVVTCVHSLTDTDVNTFWTDNEGRIFSIGKIDEDSIYLLPLVSQLDYPGAFTRSWLNHVVESPIQTLSRNGVTLTVASQEFTQLRPIQESKQLHIVVDGVEVTGEGTYHCNDLIISESLDCYNPFTVQTWFPEPVGNTVAMVLTQSFNIHGLSHRYDVVIDVKEPIKFQQYGVNQGQGLVNDSFAYLGSVVDGYDSYLMVPKVKTSVNGKRVDCPHIVSGTSDDINCPRNSATLYDTDDLPDRTITYLYNGDDYLAGFAAGLSLTKGFSVKNRRNQYIPSGNGSLYVSYANRNKFYVSVIKSAVFDSNILPSGFVANFSTYWAYFDPSVNKGQVYWYKDGNNYIIYCHYQDANSNIPVILPAEMDGLAFDVVEKTDGVTAMTDAIVNGRIYLTTDSTDHNYIVLKTK